MVRDGYYYALGALSAAGLVAWVASPPWAVVPLALGAFFLWFFRDPERVVPATPGALVSAADGKVTHVDTLLIDGQRRCRISVFLSVFDVHVNRSPVSGVITGVQYCRGKFLNAMRRECAEVNEQNIVTVEAEGQTVIFKQIAGVLARRIVFSRKLGDTVARGERVGLIKFGSRTDVIFDADADVKVRPGDRVRGGETVLAIIRSLAETATTAAAQRSSIGGQ
jgi:phosphatidylserine decarboxylase